MNDRVFFDTNILLYAFSANEPEKQRTSEKIIQAHEGCTCVQALNEFCNVCLKKWELSRADIEDALSCIVADCSVTAIERKTLRRALMLNERYGYSFYDCVMLAAALECDCEVFFSEDMSSGQMIEGALEIRNPFK